jgi:diguanylate cyclase (GGDEF)-like protein
MSDFHKNNMNLDARTLLISLVLTNAFMVVSLFVAASGGKSHEQRDGIGKWAVAILMETVTWALIAARGSIPDLFSIIVANGFLSGTYALMLAAISDFQQRSLPRWQYIVPISLMLLIASILVNDIHGRFIWGGLIYIFQMLLIGRALWTSPATHTGRAWRLLLMGIAVMVLVLGLRAFVALSGQPVLARPDEGGAIHWIQVVTFVAAMASTLLGTIGYLLMVKERTDREILHLAMTDSLTGVPNRRAMMDYAERALAQRGGRSMALLMIDVDHFKRINDTHGHLVGDEVLRQIVLLLEQRLRAGDLLGRYGGEEFCVVAQDIDAEGAGKLAESLRETVAFTMLGTERGKLSVTVSIGIAYSRGDIARELKDLLAEADTALYSAKMSGRNRVVFFSQQTTGHAVSAQ